MGTSVVRQALPDLVLGHLTILCRKRVDRGRDKPLVDAELLGIFGRREHRRIVLFNESSQIIPYRWIGIGQVDVALPYPRRVPVLEVSHQRQRLWIVDDDGVAVFDVKPGRIFEHDLLIDCLLRFGELDRFALQRVVEFFGAAEKGRRSWIMRHPVSMPMAFIISVSGVRISVTPPP